MYSNDNISWQDSNVFENLPRGKHTFYVKDVNNCTPVETVATIVNLINTITPNADGINDVLDYSQLASFDEFQFKVFDRYGQLVFTSTKDVYKWDGKKDRFPVPSGTYWYNMQWVEGKVVVLYTGWVLVKNRE